MNSLSQQSQHQLAGKYLCFSIGKEEFAMPLLQVKEVIANVDTTSIPQAQSHFKGIMNLRGQIITVIDLRTKLKLGKADYTNETAIVIMDLDGFTLGMVVDAVNAVMTFESSMLSEPPQVSSGVNLDYILGVAKLSNKLTLLIDLHKVLNVEDLITAKNQLKKAA